MIGITLKQLRYLEALSQHRHFGRAAEACAVTQPALSQQMKELEAMVGAPLIERGSRQTRLTALGERFVARAITILREVDELENLARAAQGPLAGRLRLGVIPTVAPYLLPQVITSLARRLPELDVEVKEAMTKAVIGDLMEAELDIAIVALPISEPALREFALFDEEFVLVRPKSDAERPIPRPEMLQTMRLLLLEEGHCFRDQALSYCKMADTTARQVMQGNSLATLVQMVSAGMGITLIPEMALDLETGRADVSVARFPGPRPSRTIGMVWRKTNPLAQHFTQIGAVVRNSGQHARSELHNRSSRHGTGPAEPSPEPL